MTLISGDSKSSFFNTEKTMVQSVKLLLSHCLLAKTEIPKNYSQKKAELLFLCNFAQLKPN